MDIYSLLYHFKGCPEDFLQNRLQKTEDLVHTEILVKDIYRKIYGNFSVPDSKIPCLNGFWQITENHMFAIQIGCWFFSYPKFLNRPELLPMINDFLLDDLLEVSSLVKYREWVEDEDRAEEFIRKALKRCNILLSGETLEIASDKLDALDTIKRQRVLKESNESFERIMEIRRKMAEDKAREAANVYSRE